MTAYPETCLIDYLDGDRTVITVEAPSDCDTEVGVVARITIDVNEGKIRHRVGLSSAACRVLAARLKELSK